MKGKHTGFSLTEVLIALLILSIGLLGIAGLQATSKRLGYEAIQRTTASMLAMDIIERMRTNPGQLASYTGSTITGALSKPAPYCSSATCAPAEIATYDLYEWQQAILGAAEQKAGVNTGGLVSPTGCITAGAAANEVVVAIAWRGLAKLSNPTINTCGSGTGNYDETGGDNVFRRVIQVKSIIVE